MSRNDHAQIAYRRTGLTLILFVASDALALKLTAQQVKDTCGKKLTQSPDGFNCSGGAKRSPLRE
jgi:hypothetical protein